MSGVNTLMSQAFGAGNFPRVGHPPGRPQPRGTLVRSLTQMTLIFLKARVIKSLLC